MKSKKVFRLLFFTFLFIINVNVVKATTYTSTLDDDYIYGDVSSCATSNGIAYFEGIENVSGYKACIWTRENYSVMNFKCSDDTMEAYELSNVIGKDGDKSYRYYGLGCRKLKDESNRVYEQKHLYVGYGEQIASHVIILEGDAVSVNKHNSGWIDAVKAGTAKIKVYNENKFFPKYYEYTVESPISSVSELDNKYFYGDVGECPLDKAKMNNITFAGSTLQGFSYSDLAKYTTNCSCQNPEYELFELTFKADNEVYKGYGCRLYALNAIDNGLSSNYEYSDINSCPKENTYYINNIKYCSSDSFTCNTGYDKFSFNAADKNMSRFKLNGCRKLKPVETPATDDSDDEKLTRLNYDSICAEENPGIRQAAKIVGYVVAIIKWVVPLIIIALGAVDFFKAMIANDDKEISKAGQKLIKRIIFGVVVFLIPTIIKAFIGFLEITNGIEKDEDTNFGACTKCIADPFNDCETK